MTLGVSRRGFLATALATGAAVAAPPSLRRWIGLPTADAANAPAFFDDEQSQTCAAICARIVPGSTVGAAYIDRFLTGPGIYARGPFTGRNPYPDPATGRPSSSFPADDALDAFVALSPLQELSWRLVLDGEAALAQPPPGWDNAGFAEWREQVGDLLPAPASLRTIYVEGLAAFDEYSRSVFGVPFVQATPEQQDLMLETAGNIVTGNLPLAPDAARALFPNITVHTFQACYGLPEYRGTSNASTTLWADVGWDGDTQPLGNSIYWESRFGPGEGPNAGFGEPGVYEPRGTYREHRPVSYLDGGDGRDAQTADLADLIDALRRRTHTPGRRP